MVALRSRTTGALFPARFWLSACCAALAPTSIGYQDFAALIAHDRGAGPSWHLIASPLGTVEAATFSYTRPIGSAIPEPLGLFQAVNFDPRSLDAQAWKIDEPLNARPARPIEYPSVNRARKGDRLPVANPALPDPASLPQLKPIDSPLPLTTPAQPAPAVVPPSGKMEGAEAPADAMPLAAPLQAHDQSSDDDVAIVDKPPEIPAPGDADATVASPLDELSFLDDDGGDRSAQIYFGSGVMGSPMGLQRWAPGAAPILVPPPDTDLKLSALEDLDTGAGETVVGKDSSRIESPAQRLGLGGKPRARAEKCLADAIYFEARGEVLKGQQAVAQVVMNRVFSGFYPHDVCGVVYQNASRHLACQFTFACEGKDLSRIDEPDMWEQAKRIAKDMLDGRIWLAEVGHATHYHAYWVHPSWINEMARLYKLGVHTFYRPRNWGDGEDDWGPTELNAQTMRPDPEVLGAKPEPTPKDADPAARNPQAAVGAATAKL